MNKQPWELERGECSHCSALSDCGGGCRFRAPGPTAPDPYLCAVHLGAALDGKPGG